MKNEVLPYNRQCIDEEDIKLVADTLRSSYLTTGPQALEFEKEIADFVGAKYAVVCANGTAALHLAMLAIDIGENDRVLTTPITFVADANAVRYVGGNVAFADVCEDTVNLDPDNVRKVLNTYKDIKSIIPVHFGGHPVDLEAFKDIADEFRVSIIEDACHALGGAIRTVDGVTSKIGSCKYSTLTVFSFHPIKSITTGEGGCVTTNDSKLYERLLRFRNHGIVSDIDMIQNRNLGTSEYEGKEIKNPWYYEMKYLGFNYRLTDFQCALGRSQLKKLERFVFRRRQLVDLYRHELFSIPEEWIKPLKVAKNVEHAYHLFVVKIPFDRLRGGRAAVMTILKRNGISSQVHYLPIYKHPYYQQFFDQNIVCPTAEQYYKTCLSLPLFPTMDDSDPKRIIKILYETIQSLVKE